MRLEQRSGSGVWQCSVCFVRYRELNSQPCTSQAGTVWLSCFPGIWQCSEENFKVVIIILGTARNTRGNRKWSFLEIHLQVFLLLIQNPSQKDQFERLKSPNSFLGNKLQRFSVFSQELCPISHLIFFNLPLMEDIGSLF